MKMISLMIADGTEYGRRLAQYLEVHLAKKTRIYHCTSPKSYMEQIECFGKGQIDYVLFDSALYEELCQMEAFEVPDGKLILSERESDRADTFCRYCAPKRLLDYLLSQLEEKQNKIMEFRKNDSRIYGIFCPSYCPEVKGYARSYVKEGSLYLGMDDVGSGELTTMSDLCYYIHVRSEHVMSYVEEIAVEREGIWEIPAPDLYFDLRELSYEDYVWFFECLRKQERYDEIIISFGYAAGICHDFFFLFDSLIFVDYESEKSLHEYSERIAQVIRGENVEIEIDRMILR